MIFIPFPFSDLSAVKVRPAVCLAAAGIGDWVVCQVTSNPFTDPTAVLLTPADFARGGLNRVSYARPTKLFTVNDSQVQQFVGLLNDPARQRLLSEVIRLFQPPA